MLKQFIRTCAVLLLISMIGACGTTVKKDFSWPGMNFNVCKSLRGKVVVYSVFINTKKTDKWLEEDMEEVKKAMAEGFEWIEGKAEANDVELEFDLQYWDSLKEPFKDFPGYAGNKKKAKKSDEELNVDHKKLMKWADACVKKLGPKLPVQVYNDSMPHVGIPNDMERFIARIRDENECSSVLFFWLLKTPKENSFTYAANIIDNENVEFVVSSFKRPSLFAFDALRLFGALPAYLGSNLSIASKQINKLKKEYPDDIMVDPFRDLDNVEISEFTQYMLGWRKEYQNSSKEEKDK